MEDKRNLLEDQIEAHLKKMKTLEPGSEEMGKATKELDTLYKLAQEADSDKRKALAEDEEVVRNAWDVLCMRGEYNVRTGD